MSLKEVKTPEKNVVELEIEISKDVFAEAVSRMFRKKAASITVPGFRKGKAPRNIVEKMYGKNVFYEDALNELIPEAVDSAADEAKIEAVSRPDVNLTSVDENGVKLTAKFFVKPEVSVSQYKGLAAVKEIREAGEAEMTAELNKLRERNARSVSVDSRPAQMGDKVTIDYKGYIDGEAFEGGTDEGHELVLGSESFIPGFEEQVAGNNIGEDFKVNVTFPEDYHSTEFAGKEAVFECSISQISYDELPELDDEFAKDVSEFDTLEEYKADLKVKLDKKHDDAATHAVEEQLVDALIAGLEADIPEVMFENELYEQMRSFEHRMQSYGIDLNRYMEMLNKTPESMREEFMPAAQRQVKVRLALEKVVELEKIEASEEEVNTEFDEVAKALDTSVEEARSRVDEKIIRHDIAMRKAVDLIKEAAVITEKSVSNVEANEDAAEPDLKQSDTESSGEDVGTKNEA